MDKCTIYMTFDRGDGCLKILGILQRNPFLKDFIELIKITSRQDMVNYKLTALPAVRAPGNPTPGYGRIVEEFLNSKIKQLKPTESGTVDGTGYVSVNSDDAVRFDPSKIRRPEDFQIPSGPVANIDLETLLAQQKADRQILDTEIGTGRKPY